MRKVILTLLIIGVVAAGLWLRRDEDLTRQGVSGSVGIKGLRAELTDVHGKKHTLEEFKGRPVVLHFWASWCAPCLEEIHEWVEAAKKAGAGDIQWVAVSLDEDWQSALKVLPESEVPAHVFSLLDPEKSVAEEFGSYQFPETYLLDPELRRIKKWVGPQDWNSEVILTALKELAQGKGATQSGSARGR